jgi:hypothetical protein
VGGHLVLGDMSRKKFWNWDPDLLLILFCFLLGPERSSVTLLHMMCCLATDPKASIIDWNLRNCEGNLSVGFFSGYGIFFFFNSVLTLRPLIGVPSN